MGSSPIPDELLFEAHGSVTLLTFIHHERSGAITPSMRVHYFYLLDLYRDIPDIRAIMLIGAGKSLRAGADVQELKTSSQHTIERIRQPGRPVHDALSIPKPIVCAISGGRAVISWLLPRLVGQSKTLDLLLSARVILADKAERISMTGENPLSLAGSPSQYGCRTLGTDTMCDTHSISWVPVAYGAC